MILTQEVITTLKNQAKPVIIFGAGIVGEVLLRASLEAGIQVDCFCDNNINKTKSLLCGIQVVHTEILKNKYKDAIFLISAADIKDVVEQLNVLGFSKWYAGGLLLRNFDIAGYHFSAPDEFVEYAVATCLLCHDSYLTPEKLFLRSVDIIITERCSLKCRHCSNLMQYYKQPENCSMEDISQSIDAFCSIVDEINEFRVIGGEPFMNKEIHLIIKRLINEPKVKKVVIYTNGTLLPRKEQIDYLKDNKVLFIITDYEKLSRKLSDLIKILQDSRISFYVQKAKGWTDCSTIIKHSRGIEEQKELFKACCAKNTATLSDGKLYRCPFSANTDRLLAVPEQENDYIDIIKELKKKSGIIEIKNRIKEFLLKKDFLEVCDYCSGRSFGAPEIRPGEQIDAPLEYKQLN